MKLLFGMEHPINVGAIILTCTGRQIPENSYQEQNCINLESGQKGFIQLAKREEPGEPLVIYGKVIDRQTNQTIKEAFLFLYQTDSSGIYNAAGGPDEEARIRGTIQTNESGCFKIKTILPGDYPGQKTAGIYTILSMPMAI